MEKKFIIRVSHETFEPTKKNGRVFEKTADGSKFYPLPGMFHLYMSFSDYIIEDGEAVGVILKCNLGSGYSFDYGYELIEMRVGDMKNFSYSGTCIDDEGDPEEFSIYYYLELLDFDPALLELNK